MSSSFQTEIVSLQTALCVAGESMKDPDPGHVSLVASILLGLKQTEEAKESPKTRAPLFRIPDALRCGLQALCLHLLSLKVLGKSKHSVRKPDSKTFEKQASVPSSWLCLVVFVPVALGFGDC